MSPIDGGLGSQAPLRRGGPPGLPERERERDGQAPEQGPRSLVTVFSGRELGAGGTALSVVPSGRTAYNPDQLKGDTTVSTSIRWHLEK